MSMLAILIINMQNNGFTNIGNKKSATIFLFEI